MCRLTQHMLLLFHVWDINKCWFYRFIKLTPCNRVFLQGLISAPVGRKFAPFRETKCSSRRPEYMDSAPNPDSNELNLQLSILAPLTSKLYLSDKSMSSSDLFSFTDQNLARFYCVPCMLHMTLIIPAEKHKVCSRSLHKLFGLPFLQYLRGLHAGSMESDDILNCAVSRTSRD